MPGNEAANAAARKEWLKENAKAMLLISTSIEDSQLESLLTCATAKAMWDTLSNIYEQKTETNKLILTQKFHEYRMSSSDSVVQHVAKVRNLASALKDVGEVVFDVAIMAKILASLPSKFNALKTAWDSVSPVNQTINSLIERLIKEEVRLNHGCIRGARYWRN
ncbi:copia protein [Lasius niger]|uniref:Copia protein n=1 Tax=Lasius niger TaxID=67767 RepID=A0A0J7K9Y2_LASNI|nr:copia protein [Lasius niger]